MAWQLVAEVLDHAPPDMTAAERLVLVAVAEFARVGPRTWTGPQADIARRAGLGSDGTRRVLGKLAARGLDPRVTLALDRHGRPIYAVPGRSPSFTVPRLAPPGCSCSSCATAQGVPDGTPSFDKVGRAARVGVPSGTGRRDGEPGQAGRAAHPLRTGDRGPSHAPAGGRSASAIDGCSACGDNGRLEDPVTGADRGPCSHGRPRGRATGQPIGRPA